MYLIWLTDRIQPVRFPQGLPTEGDIGYTQLHDDGRFVIYSRMEQKVKMDDDVVPQAPQEDYKVTLPAYFWRSK